MFREVVGWDMFRGTRAVDRQARAHRVFNIVLATTPSLESPTPCGMS